MQRDRVFFNVTADVWERRLLFMFSFWMMHVSGIECRKTEVNANLKSNDTDLLLE